MMFTPLDKRQLKRKVDLSFDSRSYIVSCCQSGVMFEHVFLISGPNPVSTGATGKSD